MKPTLWIHIGTHKTGTTSIEAFLKTNRKTLADQGIGLLSFPRDARRRLREQTESNETSGKILTHTLQHLITKQSRSGTRQPKTYILSWEGFCGNARKGYCDAPLMAEILSSATKFFDFNTHIMVYIRPQEEFISSYYSQTVKDGETKSIQEFLHSLPSESFNWLKLTEAFERKFGAEQVVVERYCRELFPGKNEILNNFCAHLSVNTNDLIFPSNSINSAKNAGWTKSMVEIARRLNAQISRDEQQTMKEIFNKITPQIPKNDDAYFDADAITLIRHIYSESNQKLCAKRFPSQKALFPGYNTNADRRSQRTCSETLINDIAAFNYDPNIEDSLELTCKLVKLIHKEQDQLQASPSIRHHQLPQTKRLSMKIYKNLTQLFANRKPG